MDFFDQCNIWGFYIYYTHRFNEVKRGYTGFTLPFRLSICPSDEKSANIPIRHRLIDILMSEFLANISQYQYMFGNRRRLMWKK